MSLTCLEQQVRHSFGECRRTRFPFPKERRSYFHRARRRQLWIYCYWHRPQHCRSFRHQCCSYLCLTSTSNRWSRSWRLRTHRHHLCRGLWSFWRQDNRCILCHTYEYLYHSFLPHKSKSRSKYKFCLSSAHQHRPEHEHKHRHRRRHRYCCCWSDDNV